jgi:hypothetical protein
MERSRRSARASARARLARLAIATRLSLRAKNAGGETAAAKTNEKAALRRLSEFEDVRRAR